MSERAQAFYQERADRLGLGELSPVLNGAPIVLTPPEERISIHTPSSPAVIRVREAYDEVLRAVDPFNLAAAEIVWPEISERRSVLHEARNAAHIRGVIQSLIPSKSKIKTGHLRDVRTEAIAPGELQRGLRTIAEGRANNSPTHPDAMVYLLTSAEIFAGRTLGRISCLTIAMAGPLKGFYQTAVRDVLGIRYVRSNNIHNLALITSGMDTSTAIGRLMTPQGPAADVSTIRDTSGVEDRQKRKQR